MATTQQPLNPYIAGRAVGGERGFFGRQDILREVERTLTLPDQNALVLFGQRRIGKTSILLQLERRLPSPPFVPVYFDLMYKARLPLNRVLYELAAAAAPLVGISPPAEAEFEGGNDAFRQIFLPAAYEALGEERRLVFLFDEFDVLDVAAEEKLPDTAAARAFFPHLQRLMTGELRLGFVFVVGRKTDELSTDFLATFKAARYRRVSVLKPEAAQELITLAQREGSLNFTDEVVERILALTAGHPYFTQLLCQLLFDRAYDAEPEGAPTVDAADVEPAVPDVLEVGNQAFEWVWDGLPPAERIIFSAIATHADEAIVLTEDEIMTILQGAGIRILIKELTLAPQTLVDWEMLKETEGGYRFFVELMRRWVAEQKRLEQVKDERDRVIPLADTLYQSGAGYHEANEIERAISLLQQALEVNPNHLKARLLLGTIYRKQGQLEEAVAEFEAAYRYDQVEGRYELVHTLLARGETLEREGDEDEALKAYDRVLEVSSREQVAQEQRAAIWTRRGDAALERDDLEAALAAYREAGATEKIAQVGDAELERGDLETALAVYREAGVTEKIAQVGDAALELDDLVTALAAYREVGDAKKIDQVEILKQRRALAALEAQAQAHEQAEAWAQAAAVYDQLMDQALDEESRAAWKVALKRCREAEAQAHERAERWAEAAAIYEQLAAQAPDEESQAAWQAALERCGEEEQLARLFAEGVGALEQQDWQQAQRAFVEVVHRRPDYKDAATRLPVAVQRARGEVDRISQLEKQAKRRTQLLWIELGVAPLLVTLLVAVSVWGSLSYQSSRYMKWMDATAVAQATAAEAMAQTRVAEAIQGIQLTEKDATETAEAATAATAEAGARSTATARAQGILFQDDFSSNENDWPVGWYSHELVDSVCEVIDGKYQQSATFKKDTVIVWRTVPEFSAKDFLLTVDATIIETSGDNGIRVVIIFREGEDNYYALEFSNSGEYIIQSHQDKLWKDIQGWTASGAIRLDKGVRNSFGILVKDSRFTIYANGQALTTVNDTTFSEAGRIGLGIGGEYENQTATVDFDNLLIKEVK